LHATADCDIAQENEDAPALAATSRLAAVSTLAATTTNMHPEAAADTATVGSKLAATRTSMDQEAHADTATVGTTNVQVAMPKATHPDLFTAECFDKKTW
jgi:hypothetical protein